MPSSPRDATSANVGPFLAYLRRERRLSANSVTAYRYAVTTERYTHVEPEHLRRVWDRAHPRQ